MRFFAAPILILLLMAQTYSHWFVVMAFKINQDYIAKNLCENRYRPQLQCNGNCVLMKKMREKEKTDQNQPAPRIEINTIVLSSKSFFGDIAAPSSVMISSPMPDGRYTKPIDISLPVFHPPST
jgi:hypothetical protein